MMSIDLFIDLKGLDVVCGGAETGDPYSEMWNGAFTRELVCKRGACKASNLVLREASHPGLLCVLNASQLASTSQIKTSLGK